MTGQLRSIGIVTLAVVAGSAGWPRAQAQVTSPTGASVETAFADAGAKERAVREALTAASAPRTLLRAVRTVVADYEAIARNFPADGYSDDALWRAARLSEDGFRSFGEDTDRTAAVRLLHALAARYPTSRLVAQVPGRLAGLGIQSSPVETPARSPGPAGGETARRGQARPRPDSRPVMVRGVRRLVLPDSVRVIVDLDGEVPFRDERLVNPARVFVDLSPTQALPGLVGQTLRFDDEARVVRQIRVGRHPNNTTRIVLDADGVSSYSVYPLYSPYRLVIDCLRAAPSGLVTSAPLPGPAEMPPSLLPARHLDLKWDLGLPVSEGSHAVNAPAVQPAPLASARTTPVASLASPVVIGPPQRNLDGRFSMARQLGLGVSRIVVDPGHGGHDPGAKGAGGTEAELVLDVAQRLERLLTAVPGIDVVLTRRTDEYLSLPERTAIANREKADLFLSIHANASGNRQARGIETYFLNFANSASAAAVAARENAASGQTMAALPETVRAIALNSKLDESRDFATLVQRALVQKLRASNRAARDLGVKQAPFAVLIGAAMPSVLAEVSFLTNSHEAKLLKGDVYRQRIAEALFDAIRRYQRSLKRADTVAHQP